MTIYTVTTELRTNWWLKILRFFFIKKGIEKFEICMNSSSFKKGDILKAVQGVEIKVLNSKRNTIKSPWKIFGKNPQ